MTATQIKIQDSLTAPLEILLVEDNPGDAILIKKLLKKTDSRLLGGEISLTTVGDLDEAIECVKNTKFSAVLLDLELPASEGLDTLHRLQVHASRLPIVILTGLRDAEVAFLAVRQGAQGFLHKDDLDGARLVRSLRYAIERHERQLMAEVIDVADFAVALFEVTDQESKVIFVNRACEKLTGYSPDEWRATGVSLLHGEQTAEESILAVKEVFELGERQTVEQRSYRSDGSWFWNEIHGIPLAGFDEKTTHILFSFTDVTERLQWRAKMIDLDRMTTLGTVADGLAHEINNPLSFITGNIQFVLAQLRKEIDSDRNEVLNSATMVEALKDAMEGSRRVKSVVNDLQKLAGRPDDMERFTAAIDIVIPVERSLTVVRNHINDRAQLTCHFRKVPMVIGSESKLGQVFLNLLLNAAQAITPEQRETNEICISVFQRDEDVIISISDTGKGISDAHKKRLFEPFFSTKSSQTGTGLGMAISKHIVNQAGGSIEIDSAVGEGTTVSVVLPIANDAAVKAANDVEVQDDLEEVEGPQDTVDVDITSQIEETTEIEDTAED